MASKNLTENEIETLRRWARDPSIFSAFMVSHRELLSRAADALAGTDPKEKEIDESQSGFVVMEQLLLEYAHIRTFTVSRINDGQSQSAWAKFEILVWCCHGHCMTTQYGDTLATAAGRVRTHFAANPALRTRFGVGCGRLSSGDNP